MDFLKKYPVTPQNILKAIGLLLGAVIVLAVLVSLFKMPFGGMTSSGRAVSFSVAPSMNYTDAYDSAKVYSEESYAVGQGMPSLSTRNILPVPPSQGSVGSTAEDFEVTDYSASIETRHLGSTCDVFTALKAQTYAIFESSNEGDHNCNYRFKVEHGHVQEVLAIIKSLDPKDLSESRYTIKRQIDDFTSETDILKKKLATIEKTLNDALNAYNEITVLATRTQDVASLAKIIDSKIQTIERLTQERINVSEQLERFARAKDEQLDRLDYTYFSVSVYENKFVDWENISDSWKEAVRESVRNINAALQDITIHLVAFLFLVVQLLVYFFVLVIVAKYGWRFAKYVWKK